MTILTPVIHDWDASFPSCPASWNEQIRDQLIRTSMDNGTNKTRRRYTGIDLEVDFTLRVKTNATMQNMREYFVITLRGGIDKFKFTDPQGVVQVLRIIGQPKFSNIGAQNWICSIKAERTA